MSMKTKLQTNNTALQAILETINSLPEEMIDAFAVISVTYPEGGICTCSNENRTLELDDTSGTGFFLVDEIGTWTVSCIDGESTESQTVEITEKGQTVSVELIVLPDEYQAVEYLESTGTQYINTQFFADSLDLSAEIDMAFVSLPSDGTICGVDVGSVGSYYYFAGYANSKWFMGPGALVSSNLSATAGVRYYLQSKLSVGDCSLIVNGESVIQNSTQINKQYDLPFYLFANNREGAASARVSIKLYGAKFYSSDETKRHFIPCYRKSDFVAGLYDRVSKTFFTNAGTGVFTIGPEIGGCLWLYKTGYEAEGITGDWVTSASYGGSPSIETERLYIYASGRTDVNSHASIYTKEKVDVSNFSTLHVSPNWILSHSSGGYGTYVCLWATPPTSYSAVLNGAAMISNNETSLDISSLTGSYYIGLGAHTNGVSSYYVSSVLTEVYLS